MKFMYCLMQLLTWEIDTRKHKQLLKCEECLIRDKCKKYLEQQGEYTQKQAETEAEDGNDD